MAKELELFFVGTGKEKSRTPLAIVPDRFRNVWRDEFATTNAARARALKKEVAPLDCKKFKALVLGGRETCTTWLPVTNGGVIARWIDAPPGDNANVVRAAAGVPERAWKPCGELVVRDPKLAMFPALDSVGKPFGAGSPWGPLGAKNHPFGWIPISLKPGTYAIDLVKKHSAEKVTLQLIRLRKGAAAAAPIAAPPLPPPPPKTPAKQKKNESYDDYVARLLSVAALDARTKKVIEALRRPAVFVSTSRPPPREVGASRIGGDPDLPVGTPWPKHAGKPPRRRPTRPSTMRRWRSLGTSSWGSATVPTMASRSPLWLSSFSASRMAPPEWTGEATVTSISMRRRRRSPKATSRRSACPSASELRSGSSNRGTAHCFHRGARGLEGRGVIEPFGMS